MSGTDENDSSNDFYIEDRLNDLSIELDKVLDENEFLTDQNNVLKTSVRSKNREIRKLSRQVSDEEIKSIQNQISYSMEICGSNEVKRLREENKILLTKVQFLERRESEILGRTKILASLIVDLRRKIEQNF